MKRIVYLVICISFCACNHSQDIKKVIDTKSITLKIKSTNIAPLLNKKELDYWAIDKEMRLAKMHLVNNNNYDITVYSELNHSFFVREWFESAGKQRVLFSGFGVGGLTKDFVKAHDSTILYLSHHKRDSLYFNFEWQKIGVDSVCKQTATLFYSNDSLKALFTTYVERKPMREIHQLHRSNNKYIK